MSAVSGGLQPSALYGLTETSSAQPTQVLPSVSSALGGSSGESSGVGDSAEISGLAQLYSQLNQLQSQNPTLFIQVTSEVAGQLRAASTQATGSNASLLSNLADKFQTASYTGDGSALKPAEFGPNTTPPGVWAILLAALANIVG